MPACVRNIDVVIFLYNNDGIVVWVLSELPNNTCVYEYEWIGSTDGGERRRTENEKTADLKQVVRVASRLGWDFFQGRFERPVLFASQIVRGRYTFPPI